MKTKIRLLGTSFVLHSDQEEEYIQELVSYFKSHIDIVRKDVDCKDPLKASIMAALLIAHDLFTLRADVMEERTVTRQVAKKLSMELEAAVNG